MVYLIVGIDPGTTTGIAALDFRGNVVGLHSSKDAGIDRVVDHLVAIGKTSLIASDVAPIQEFTSKLAACLGAEVFVPGESLSVNEKILLVRDYETGDSHQRDALAAALNAYNRFKNKFQKIDSLNFDESSEFSDKVKHLLLHGKSIERAVAELRKEKEERQKDTLAERKLLDTESKKNHEKPKPITPDELRIKDERIKTLEKQNLYLQEKIIFLENELKNLKASVSRIRLKQYIEPKGDVKIKEKDRIISSLEYKISVMEKDLSGLSLLKGLLKNTAERGISLVGVFPEAINGLTCIKRRLKHRDANQLRNVKLAFTNDASDREYLTEQDIVVGDVKYLKSSAGYFYILSKDLHEILHAKKKLPEAFSLERLIEDYQTERESREDD